MPNYSNFRQVLNDLENLIHDIEVVRQRLVRESGIPYGSQDARQVALEGLQCDIGACGNWIKALMSLKSVCQGSFGVIWEAKYRELIGTRLDSGPAEDLMLDYLRNTLPTKIHFKIENLFSNILKALSSSPLRGFWRISDAMLQQAGISTTGDEKARLAALANLRNSFHTNGMHGNDNASVDVDGTKFEFCKGTRVQCASWKHILVIVRSNISVVEQILFSTPVSNHSSEIADDFASGGREVDVGRTD